MNTKSRTNLNLEQMTLIHAGSQRAMTLLAMHCILH